MIAVVGLICFVRRKREDNNVAIPLVSAICLMGPWLVSAALCVSPFVRNYTPMLPVLALAIGWSVVEAVQAVFQQRSSNGSTTLATVVSIIAILLVCLPSTWTYESRLIEHRKQELPEDDYYLYHAADFHPAEVVQYLAETIEPTEKYLLCFTDQDQMELGYYLSSSFLPYRRTAGDPTQGDWAVVYLISAGEVDYDTLAKKCGVSPKELQDLPLAEDFGYFKIHRSVGQQWIRIPSR